MTSKILVTGGAGMIGAAVVRALVARGERVGVLDSGVAAGFDNLAGTGADLIHGDIRDRDAVDRAVNGTDAIVHVAAIPRNWSEIGKARRVLGYEPRVELRGGLRAMLEWFRDSRRD